MYVCACEISFYQIVSVTDTIDAFMYCNNDKTCYGLDKNEMKMCCSQDNRFLINLSKIRNLNWNHFVQISFIHCSNYSCTYDIIE